MKYRDLDGQFKEITIKTSDTLPVGSVVEYDGSTPPTGWSKVSDHDGNVIVSSEEPTTGEEVWLQKGKNLFDKNNYNLFNGLIDDSSLIWLKNTNGNFIYLEVKPNTTYTISKKTSISEFAVASGVNTPVIGEYATKFVQGSNKNVVTITTGANDKYLYVYVYYNTVSSGTLEEALNSLEIEEGSSIKPKKIHTKNDNGVYEEFYNEENREVYSTSEQRIGTWIDGKPLYRKTIHSTSTTGSLGVDFDFIRFKDFSALIDGRFLLPVARYTGTTDHLDFSINVVNKTFNFTLSDAWSEKFDNMTFDIEYTKTTD